jgi:exonuclease VII small subunit
LSKSCQKVLKGLKKVVKKLSKKLAKSWQKVIKILKPVGEEREGERDL